MSQNVQTIKDLLEDAEARDLLDIGCDDGRRTLTFAAAAHARSVHGVDVVDASVAAAVRRGIDAVVSDLADQLPYPEGRFDVVCSNQVIEHVTDTDHFVAEIFRVLRPGGYAVVSTENLASWHNIFALAFGWQPFSLTNVSAARLGLGNPLAVHRDEQWQYPPSWQHRRVFAYRGLVELFECHGFDVEAVRGAGYYPLPGRVARFDPRHAAFLTVKARREARPQT